MYAYIKGSVEEICPDRIIVEASGVGYELLCSSNTIKCLNKKEQAKLYTHLVAAQDSVTLYGFADVEERAMFRRLIGVNRVGPKLAQSILSSLSVSDIAAAVLTENAAAFKRVPGLGAKTAARVLLELKERISLDEFAGRSGGTSSQLDMRAEATAALVALGYDGAAASRAVASLEDCKRVEEMITKALRSLAR
ncbi:MAG: Holliday junction ATP-dependent DNA helicase RuvA [Firmicutes bacterium ADurb.Bin182]|nr:MAG: Holliday junction ATP-dependent DNA helicase RuvA [Firmicutes bacterium ADurb.Bin182]